MPAFPSRPLSRGKVKAGMLAHVSSGMKRRPFLLFGAPFIVTIALGSFGLSYLTQTKYDYNATKVKSMSKAEELGMRKDRRKIDVREEYFKLNTGELDEWEPKRIERPAGTPEWGLPPSESVEAPKRSGWFSKLRNEEAAAATPDSLSNGQGRTARGSGTKSATVLGPDGKPCRACNSKLAFTAAMKGGKATGTGSSTAATPGVASAAAITSTPASHADESSAKSCPPDGEELGRSTWTFLHSAAAYYPYAPSRLQKESMLALLRALPHIYPCAPCATSLGEEYAREAHHGQSWNGDRITLDVAVENGKNLRRYLCGLHNEVNERLGKPTWKCEEDLLRQRWKDGPDDGSCD